MNKVVSEVKPGDYFRLPYAGALPSLVVRVVGPGMSDHHLVENRAGHQSNCLLSSCHPFPKEEGDALFAQGLEDAGATEAGGARL